MKLDLRFEENQQNINVHFLENEEQINANLGEISVINVGQDGATFIPSVSDDGIISWTNDRDLQNPQPVNIKGEKGDKGDEGKTPIKGVDYYTDADKQEIAEQAAELIDIPEGGGVTSWNDLEDRPFGESTVEQELVASTSITVPSSQVGTTKLWSALISGFVPAVGERYTIEATDAMTGKKLSTTAICEKEVSTFLTNYKIGENTDTVYCYGSITSVSVYVNGTGYGGWRIEIYKEVATIKTLDEKYLPDSVVFEIDLDAKGYQTEEQVTELINNALGVIENARY